MTALYICLFIYLIIAIIAGFSASNTLDSLAATIPEVRDKITPVNRFFGCLIYALAWPFFLLAPLVQRAFGVK